MIYQHSCDISIVSPGTFNYNQFKKQGKIYFMATKTKSDKREAQNPLILRCHRLMEAFAKSNDERDFYMDRTEGFLIYVDLDKPSSELQSLEKTIELHKDRYCPIPKLTFYETKKIMEGFVNEKVYDIDTKEKLLEIIQSKEARENFLEFIYDHHSELEKWQQYYQERSRIRIIEWLRQNHFHFVFEEDLEMAPAIIEKLKQHLFDKSAGKELEAARKALFSKAKTYYSNEALNPRPKRGRPPKQVQKLELEPQMTGDMFTTVPSDVRPFLYIPEISSLFDVTFSTRFESGEQMMAHRRQPTSPNVLPESLNSISQKLAAMRQLSSLENKPGASPHQSKEPLFELDPEDKAIFKKLEASSESAKINGEPRTKSAPKAHPPKPIKKMVVKSKSVKTKAASKPPSRPASKPSAKSSSKPSSKSASKPAPKSKVMLRRVVAKPFAAKQPPKKKKKK